LASAVVTLFNAIQRHQKDNNSDDTSEKSKRAGLFGVRLQQMYSFTIVQGVRIPVAIAFQPCKQEYLSMEQMLALSWKHFLSRGRPPPQTHLQYLPHTIFAAYTLPFPLNTSVLFSQGRTQEELLGHVEKTHQQARGIHVDSMIFAADRSHASVCRHQSQRRASGTH
jgi:hypothetical protein